MHRLSGIILKPSRWMTVIAGIALTFMIVITVADVILRSFSRPILGTYELVALLGAVVIGFSMPFTSWVKGHVYVDFFILKLPPNGRKILSIFTKFLVIGLFLVIGWNLIILGGDLKKAGEVSLTLQIPFYPVVYGLGICCFCECVVLLFDIIIILGQKHE